MHISADIQRITLNASCMTISGERTEQLNIFCRVTGFTSDFLSFIDVELIRFFHGALKFYFGASDSALWCWQCAPYKCLYYYYYYDNEYCRNVWKFLKSQLFNRNYCWVLQGNVATIYRWGGMLFLHDVVHQKLLKFSWIFMELLKK